MSGRAAALFDSDSDGSEDEKLNTAARARNISHEDTRTTTRSATSSSSSSSSSSDATRLFTNITPDSRDDIDDESLRARLLSLVHELRQGKPPRVIDMVLRGIVHDPLRARVYEVAGVRDPQAPEEDVVAEEDHDEDDDEDIHVKTTVNRTTPARNKPVVDDDEDEDVEVKHVNQQHHEDEHEDEEPAPLRQPSPTFTRSSRASSTHSEKPKKSKRSRRHHRSSSPAPSITSTTSYDDRITMISDEQRVTSLDVIESDAQQYDEPHALLTLVFILGAVSSADLLIIFPSLYSYLDHLGRFSFLIYGFVASGYNAGQILAAPLLGWWTDKRTIKEVLLFCTACLCAGSLMYIFANSNVILLIMGRFVAGLGAANVFIAYAHIAKCSKTKEQRQMRHTRYGWLLRLTSILAPGIGSLGSRISGDREIIHDATLNSFTFPAMIMTIIFGCLLIIQLIHAIFTRNHAEKNFSQRFDDADLEAGRLRLGGDSFLTRDGIVLLLVYGMILLASLLLVTLGSLMLTQFESLQIHEWQIYVTAVFLGSGYTIGIELIPRMFAALTGVEFASLGLRMSYFFAVASLSASFGPLLGALAIHFTDLPTLGLITLGGCLAITALVIAVPPSKMDGQRRSQITIRNSNRSGLRESLLASPARVYS